ncbi:FecR domain-containing protein [Thauera linaloolentis]|uniref:FecR protein n=1 Tax=Thauera linaloolentis (strain DSM 12138 / JCM 21573 / CCUG 41526 / CIP 105981 / IAM 15112 / NBRC 102519 / 47Lol) TaxID=1123367 RepID=N6Z9C4_THAL4|nr:FecR domain-containing protein [Thauera linaloolentis]ENO88754.1 FecR protein [Thauera linaloolentis 47Lol = DSM 12138]MCM8564937.1 FecR domain-containing protein [Thauera linaloolentis]
MTETLARRPDAATLERAAAWYLDLLNAAPDAPQHQEHARWLALDPMHRQAWERVQRLQHTFGQLPGAIGRDTFQSARASRRQLIKKLSVLLMAGGAGTLAWRQKETIQALAATHRTATGERTEITLTDGGHLQLNTATALDVRYGASQREIRLHHGEILVTTAPDPQRRPFIVRTRHGSIRALGTRFAVRADRGGSLVQVFEHAVEIRPTDSTDALLLEAGQQARFSATATQATTALEANADAWSKGLLAVDNWPLGRVIDELARHHKGHLGCDPAIAQLTLSGVFHLDDIPGVLQNLTATLPIRVVYRSRYWVRVIAA